MKKYHRLVAYLALFTIVLFVFPYETLAEDAGIIKTDDFFDVCDNEVIPFAITNTALSSGRRPSDTNFENQNTVMDIDIPMLWNIRTNASAVRIGVIGSGIQADHEDLSANFAGGASFLGEGGNASEDISDVSHETRIASIIGAVGNNEKGMAGVCWNTQLYAYQMSESDGYYLTSTAIEAIETAQSDNIQIINFSSGGYYYFDVNESTAISSFDGLFICSAGNDSFNIDQEYSNPVKEQYGYLYPACYTHKNILVVGATDEDQMASFSNYGATSVDVFAPGRNVYSANKDGGYDNGVFYGENGDRFEHASGTSYAAPYVAGIAALIWSVNPDFSAEEVKDIIIDTVDKLDSLDGKCVSEGRVNAYKALEEAYVRTPAATGAQPGKTLVEPQTVTGDVNGDGYEDMVVTGNADGYFRFTSFLGQSDGSFGQGVTTFDTGTPFTNSGKSGKEKLYIGDINGDGKDDLLMHYLGTDTNRHLITYTSLGNGKFAYAENVNTGIPYDLTNYHSSSYLQDVTNDGADDFVFHIDNAGKRSFKVYLGTDGASFANIANSAVVTTSSRAYVSTDTTYMGDVSGDGKADLVVHWVNSSTSKRQLLTYIADSGGKFKEAVNLATSNTHDEVQYPGKMTLGDYSGDGKADFVVMWKNSNGKRCLLVYKSTGSTFAAGSHVLTSVRAYLTSDPIHFTDVTGDGRMDVVVHWVDSATEYRQLMTYVATASGYNEAVNCATSNKHNTTTYPTTQHMLNADGAVGKDFVGKWTSAASNHILRLKTYKAKSSANYFNPTTVDTDMNYFPYYVFR